LDGAVCHSGTRQKEKSFVWCGNILERTSSNLFLFSPSDYCVCTRLDVY
jgi:hypothetical protein